MTDIEKMMARIKELEAQVAKKSTSRLTLKVSDKGGVSVYGMGRFPVTLYAEQWTRLIEFAPEITTFLKANNDKLKFKGETA